TAFTAASAAEVGLFGEAFFGGTGIWHSPEWIVISLVAAALIWIVAYSDVKFATRSLLAIEAVSVTLILILIVWIYAKVIGGSAPNGQHFTLKPFSPPHGVGIGAIAFASVFGFLSWAGFEGAAALGEETNNPRRNIPLAIGWLSLLVAYIATNVGAFKFLVIDRRENPLQTVILGAAVAALVYVIYKNVRGVPYPYKWFPYVVLGWLVLGGAIIAAAPGLARRIGANLTRAEGMGRAGPTA